MPLPAGYTLDTPDKTDSLADLKKEAAKGKPVKTPAGYSLDSGDDFPTTGYVNYPSVTKSESAWPGETPQPMAMATEESEHARQVKSAQPLPGAVQSGLKLGTAFAKQVGLDPGDIYARGQHFVEHPVDTFVDALKHPPIRAGAEMIGGIVKHGREEVGEAYRAAREGSPAATASHLISAVPIIGPALDAAVEQAQKAGMTTPQTLAGVIKDYPKNLKTVFTDPSAVGTALGAGLQAAGLFEGGYEGLKNHLKSRLKSIKTPGEVVPPSGEPRELPDTAYTPPPKTIEGVIPKTPPEAPSAPGEPGGPGGPVGPVGPAGLGGRGPVGPRALPPPSTPIPMEDLGVAGETPTGGGGGGVTPETEKPETPRSHATGGALQPQEATGPQTQADVQKASVLLELEPSILDMAIRETEIQDQMRRDLETMNVSPEDAQDIIRKVRQQGEEAYANGDHKAALEAAHHELLLESAVEEYHSRTPEEQAARSHWARGGEAPDKPEAPPVPERPAEATPQGTLFPPTEATAPEVEPGYVGKIVKGIGKGKKAAEPSPQMPLPFGTSAEPPAAVVPPAPIVPPPTAPVVAPPPAEKPPTATVTQSQKPLWEMTRDELDKEHEDAKKRDQNDLVSLFGEDGAKKYQRLQKQANGMDHKKADKASAEIEKMEGALTPEQQNLLFGVGDTRHSLEDVKAYRDAQHQLDASSPETLAHSLRWAVSQIGDPGIPVESMTNEQRVRYAQLQEAFRIASQNGWDTSAIIKEAIGRAATRFSDPEDALFMLEKIARAVAPAGTPEAAAKTPPTLEAAVPEPPPEKPHKARKRGGKDVPEPMAVPYQFTGAEDTHGRDKHYEGGGPAEVWRVHTDAGDIDVFVHPGQGEQGAMREAAKLLGQNLGMGVSPERIFNRGTYKPTPEIQQREKQFTGDYGQGKAATPEVPKAAPGNVVSFPELYTHFNTDIGERGHTVPMTKEAADRANEALDSDGQPYRWVPVKAFEGGAEPVPSAPVQTGPVKIARIKGATTPTYQVEGTGIQIRLAGGAYDVLDGDEHVGWGRDLDEAREVAQRRIAGEEEKPQFRMDRAPDARPPLMPPATTGAQRPNIALRETLPGAKDHYQRLAKNYSELERMQQELISVNKDDAKLQATYAQISGSAPISTIRRMHEEMEQINQRRTGIRDHLHQLEQEYQTLRAADPHVGEVRLDAEGNPTLYLNKTAMGLMQKVIQEGVREGELHGADLTIPEARWVKNRLDSQPADINERRLLPHLGRLVDMAIARSKQAGIAVVGKMGAGIQSAIGTKAEELFHRFQRMRSENGRHETHLSREAFLNLFNELPDGVYDYLRNNGYEHDPAKGGIENYVIEAAAKIATNKWPEMGITKKEAFDWLKRYFDEVIQKHGAQAIIEIGHVRGFAREMQREVGDRYGSAATEGAAAEPATQSTAGETKASEPDRTLHGLPGRGSGEAVGDISGRNLPEGRGVDEQGAARTDDGGTHPELAGGRGEETGADDDRQREEDGSKPTRPLSSLQGRGREDAGSADVADERGRTGAGPGVGRAPLETDQQQRDQLKTDKPQRMDLRRAQAERQDEDWLAEGVRQFAEQQGLQPPTATPVESDARVMEIADAYDAMKHEPDNPQVKASYDALKSDIDKQWDHATGPMGVTFEPWNESGQPYKNSAAMVADVKNNHHLFFFRDVEMAADHPMAEVDPKTGLTYNEKLRAIHDLFGHAVNENQFGQRGEENAWIDHSKIFSAEAVPALTSETKGQNSWVNSGPHMRGPDGKLLKKGDPGWKPATERPYAENKAGLLPERFHYRLDSPVSFVSPNVHDIKNLTEAERRLASRTHKLFQDVGNDLAVRMGIRSVANPALGHWQGGAENSVVTHFLPGTDPDAVIYHAAMMARVGNQNFWAAFIESPGGKDRLYAFHVHDSEASPDKIASILADNDIKNSTIEKNADGHTVWVASKEGSLRSNVQEAAQQLGGKDAGEFEGRSEEGGSHDSREAAVAAHTHRIEELERAHPEWLHISQAVRAGRDYSTLESLTRETREPFLAGVHGSRTGNIVEVSPEFAGKGPHGGGEAKRAAAYPEIFPKRSYFRIEGQPGAERFYTALPEQYRSLFNRENLVDLRAQLEELMAEVPDAGRQRGAGFTRIEKLIKDKGYDGYFDSEQGVIVAFTGTPVESKLRSGGVNLPDAGEEQKPTRFDRRRPQDPKAGSGAASLEVVKKEAAQRRELIRLQRGLLHFDPSVEMGNENGAALIAGDGSVAVGDYHNRIRGDVGYGGNDFGNPEDADRWSGFFFNDGGVRVRANSGHIFVEFGNNDPATFERVRNVIQALPGDEFTTEYTPPSGGGRHRYWIGDRDSALERLDAWEAGKDRPAPAQGSMAHWREQEERQPTRFNLKKKPESLETLKSDAAAAKENLLNQIAESTEARQNLDKIMEETEKGESDARDPALIYRALQNAEPGVTFDAIVENTRTRLDWDDIQRHMLPGEREKYETNPELQRKTTDIINMAPDTAEWDAAVKVGMIGRLWYERSSRAFDALIDTMPDTFKKRDKDKFLNFVAALSPVQTVRGNLIMAINMWDRWNRAGRPQDVKWQDKKNFEKVANPDATLYRLMKGGGQEAIQERQGGLFPGAEPGGEQKTRKAKGVDLESRLNNAIRALQGQPMSGPKVSAFAPNLGEDVDKSTNDTWMAVFADINPNIINQKSYYDAVTVMVRMAAEKNGIPTRQAQAAIWSFIKSLAEMSGWGKNRWIPPQEVLDNNWITPDLIALHSQDFADLLKTDHGIRSKLEDIGGDLNVLDRKLKRRVPAKPAAADEGTIKESLERLSGAARRLEAAKSDKAIQRHLAAKSDSPSLFVVDEHGEETPGIGGKLRFDFEAIRAEAEERKPKLMDLRRKLDDPDISAKERNQALIDLRRLRHIQVPPDVSEARVGVK